MKHNIKITLIILSMFLITQFIGLYVVNSYTPYQEQIINPETGETINRTIDRLPGFFQTPTPETQTGFLGFFIQLIFAFVIAVFIIMILSKYKFKMVMKLWFLFVVFIALYLAFNAFIMNYNIHYIIPIIIALPLAFLKIFKPNILIHNSTELLIYPGIAAVFVPILNFWTMILLLIIISIYDIWAVWHSGIMQKMAKFYMNELKVFGGFMIPYMTKKQKTQFKKAKTKKQKNKLKISLGILGGGDVVFPIITAGVILRLSGLIPALFVTFGAFIGLATLLFNSQKKKFYPAMPFITAGMFAGLLLAQLLGFLF